MQNSGALVAGERIERVYKIAEFRCNHVALRHRRILVPEATLSRAWRW